MPQHDPLKPVKPAEVFFENAGPNRIRGTELFLTGQPGVRLQRNARYGLTDNTGVRRYIRPSVDRVTWLGEQAIAQGIGSSAFGALARALDRNTTAVGAASRATGGRASAFGSDARASAYQSLAAGNVATATGIRGISIGTAALASGQDSSSVGTSSTATAVNSIAIGRDAQAGGSGAIAIGQGTRSDISGVNNSAVVIGNAAASSSLSSIAIGVNIQNDGDYAVVLGSGALAGSSGDNGIAIGRDADVEHDSSICLGRGTVSTAANQLVIGQTGSISSAFIGNGVTASSPTAITLNATGGSGANVAGASFSLAGGRSTGNAAGGSLLFRTSPAGGAGSVLNALVTQLTIASTGAATFASTISATIGYFSTRVTVGVSTNETGLLYTGSDAGGQSYFDSSARNRTIFNFRTSGGTQAARTDVADTDNAMEFQAWYWSGGSYFGGALVRDYVDGTFVSGQSPPSGLRIYTALTNAAAVLSLGVSAAGQTLARDGSLAAPGYSFINSVGTGLYQSGGSVFLRGTGTVNFVTAAAIRWAIDDVSPFSLSPNVDNTYDLGIDSTTDANDRRIRSGYFGTRICSGTAQNEAGLFYAGANSAVESYLDTAVTGVGSSSVFFRKSRGTQAARTNVASADEIGTIDFRAFSGATGYWATARIQALVDGAVTDNQRPASRIEFTTNVSNGAQTNRVEIDGAGNVVLNGQQAALATTATDGFTYIPTCAGTPTGVPTTKTGAAAMVFDTTNNAFYVYKGAWVGVILV